jgi:hypothetical protein
MAVTPSSSRLVQLEAALVTSRCAGKPRPRTAAPNLIAVTGRPAVRLRIAAVSAQLGLPPPIFRERVDDLLAAGNDVAVVILDLSCCCTDTGLPRLIGHWARGHPGTELVLFAPLLDRDSELEATLALLRSAGDARLRVMTTRDFYRDEIWRTLAALRERVILERELRAEFLAAVARTGRSLRAASDVLDLLDEAARQAAIDARVEAPVAGVQTSAVQIPNARAVGERERKVRWKQLRRAGQMPASSLRLVFRVLWYTKLRQIGWSTARVAEFLDFASPREFRRAIRRRLGIGVRYLRWLRYPDALGWAAELVVTEHARRGGTTAHTLAAALQRHTALNDPTIGHGGDSSRSARR